MVESLQHLDRYSSLLESYIEAPSEHILVALAGLGRDLVLEDVHPEDIAELHEKALGDITRRFAGSSLSAVGRPAGLGLMEVLMAYGMALRDRTSVLEMRQKELKQNEARLQHLLNSSPAVIYTISPVDFGITYMSGNVRNILGYEPTQFVETPSFWTDRIHPDDVDRVQFERASTDDTEQLTSTYRMRRENGDYIWVRDAIARMAGVDSRSADLIGCLVDVTAQIRAKKREQDLMDHMAESIITFDEDGNIEYCNQVILRVFGYQQHELTGRPIDLLKFEPPIMSLCAPLMSSPEPAETDLREIGGRHKDGYGIFLEAKVSRLESEDRHLFLASLHDIGERKEAEKERETLKEQLRHSNRVQAIGALAGGIAHDFNNILVPILGLTEVTMNRLPEDGQDRINLSTVIIAAEQAKSLVSNLLRFSRQDDLQHESLRLQEVIPEALSLLRAAIPAMISIESEIDESCGPIQGTTAQVHQIILNLGVNAAKAMGSGGTFKVSLEERDDEECETGARRRQAVLTVSDTGCGMQPALLEKIFEPFFSTRAPNEGSGIGLSVVSDIVKSYSGEISVSSKLGNGTEFRLSLPISTENEVA